MTKKSDVSQPFPIKNLLQLLILGIFGFLLILLCSKLQHIVPPQIKEYHFSNFLVRNYSLLTAIFFAVAGFTAGYFFKYNPWFIGFGLVLIFPACAIIEFVLYRNSHTLIPFEFVMYAIFALAPVAAAYAGRFIANKIKAAPKNE